MRAAGPAAGSHPWPAGSAPDRQPWPTTPTAPTVVTGRPGVAPGSPATGPLRNPDTDTDTGVDDPKFSLTATQVVASMSAAVVAAFIGAQLGVAGTIVGAALASVISVVGSAVIGHSLLVTRRTVTRTVQHARGGESPDREETTDRTVLLTAVTRQDLQHAALMGGPTGAAGRTDDDRSVAGRPATPATPRSRSWWSRPGRIRWALIGLATSVLVFAGALGLVTVVEAVKGAPISGGSQGGFSVLGGHGGSGGANDGTDDGDPSTPSTVTPTTTAATGSSAAPTGSSTAPTSPTTTAPSSTSSSPSTTSTTSPSTTPASRGAATSGATGTG